MNIRNYCHKSGSKNFCILALIAAVIQRFKVHMDSWEVM